MKILVSLSGGMDSATVLALARDKTRDVEAVAFTYGSKHNQYEMRAAADLAAYYVVPFKVVDMTVVFSGFDSALMKDNGSPIPEGHYTDKSMARTVVPGRNLIFASILAGMAESRKLEEVWMGMHAGDHAIYPDCRPDFFFHAAEAVDKSTERRVKLVAPFLFQDKTQILQIGLGRKVPYHLTRTCYQDQEKACGKCGSCRERQESFHNNGTVDPVEYEYRHCQV